jgi:hypothetical protein
MPVPTITPASTRTPTPPRIRAGSNQHAGRDSVPHLGGHTPSAPFERWKSSLWRKLLKGIDAALVDFRRAGIL